MDMKTFGYLYYKTRDCDKAEILKEAEISEEEYELMEQSYASLLQEIKAEHPRAADIGSSFVRLTRYIYEGKSDQELGLPRPDAVKARTGELFALPAIGRIKLPEITLQQAIEQRRSLRKYSETAFNLDELSFLLWASCWARDFHTSERMELTRRNVPSAGSRHPFECYLLIRRVEGLKPGLYYYHPIKHCLIGMAAPETIAADIYEACLRQDMVQNAAVTFILSAVPYRTSWRYGQRAYRYLYLDAGHVGQNIHLAAEAVGAGACMIGAYQDEAMNDCIGVDGVQEFVLYIATVGKK